MGKESMTMETIGSAEERIAAEDLIVRCGVRVDLKGSEYLVDGALLFGLNGMRGCYKIYDAIAEMRGVRAKTVMQEMSYAINKAYDITQGLSELVGVKIPKGEIHNGLVMGYLGRELNRNRVMKEIDDNK